MQTSLQIRQVSRELDFQLPPNSRKGILESGRSGHLHGRSHSSPSLEDEQQMALAVAEALLLPCPSLWWLSSTIAFAGPRKRACSLTTPCVHARRGPARPGFCRLGTVQAALSSNPPSESWERSGTPRPVHVSRKGPSLAHDADALRSLWACACALSFVPSSLGRAWYPRRRRFGSRRLGLTRTRRTR